MELPVSAGIWRGEDVWNRAQTLHLIMQMGLDKTDFSVHPALQDQSHGGQGHHSHLWVPAAPRIGAGEG